MKRPTIKQAIFYTLVFLFGVIYQPVWVYENFWYKAQFYDSLPFDFPYYGFIFIYCSLSTLTVATLVRLAKKHL
jgi:hypothetical protein